MDAVLRETLGSGTFEKSDPLSLKECWAEGCLQWCSSQKPLALRPDAGLLQEIVNTDAVLRETLEAGGAPFKMVEAWDQLQLQCATYINSDLPGLQAGPMAKPSKPVRCGEPSTGPKT